MIRKRGKPIKILIDTCVWLDLAKDYRQEPVLRALDDLTKSKAVELIVPEIVLAEFERNKVRVIEVSHTFVSCVKLSTALARTLPRPKH